MSAGAPLTLARPELKDRVPYRPPLVPAGLVRLHSNESPWAAPGTSRADELNRYPTLAATLEQRMADVYGVAASAVLATRGSNDAIDLLVRAFCRAGEDAILTPTPTFAMYGEFAAIQNAGIVTLATDPDAGFAVDVAAVADAWQPGVKLIFLCSPNNPTGHAVAPAAIADLLSRLDGRALVVVDEAYIEFCSHSGVASLIAQWPCLVVLRTLSKAYALAGARVGALLANADVVGLLRSILPPYALSDPAARLALAALAPDALASAAHRFALIRDERKRVAEALAAMPQVTRVWPSEANFLLLEPSDQQRFVRACRDGSVLVRTLDGDALMQHSVRITIGSRDDNDRLLLSLNGANGVRCGVQGAP